MTHAHDSHNVEAQLENLDMIASSGSERVLGGNMIPFAMTEFLRLKYIPGAIRHWKVCDSTF